MFPREHEQFCQFYVLKMFVYKLILLYIFNAILMAHKPLETAKKTQIADTNFYDLK